VYYLLKSMALYRLLWPNKCVYVPIEDKTINHDGTMLLHRVYV